MEVKTKALNYYQTEVMIDGKRLVLSDTKKKKDRNRKVGDAIISVILTIVIVSVFLCILFTHNNKGHWEADYVKDGILYDTDQDGDYYHWVNTQD